VLSVLPSWFFTVADRMPGSLDILRPGVPVATAQKHYDFPTPLLKTNAVAGVIMDSKLVHALTHRPDLFSMTTGQAIQPIENEADRTLISKLAQPFAKGFRLP